MHEIDGRRHALNNRLELALEAIGPSACLGELLLELILVGVETQRGKRARQGERTGRETTCERRRNGHAHIVKRPGDRLNSSYL